MKHILVAIDGSDASFRALEHATDLTKRLDTGLTVLIVRLIIVGRAGVFPALSKQTIDDIKSRATDVCHGAGLQNAKVRIEKSRDTAFKIVDIAIEEDADLIVMGASGISGFKAFMLGSISQEVLKKSACPVTIVH